MKQYLIPLAFLCALMAGPALASAEDAVICTMQYQPVCGAQQVQCFAAPCYPQYHTYGNSCTLSAEKGTFIHEGECTAEETGPVKTDKPYVPPAGCVSWNDGCNSCSRQSNGAAICTMMACTGPARPGRCLAYEATKPLPTPEPAPVDSGTISSPVPPSADVATASDATTSEPVAESFVSRIWHTILGWFSWLN